MRDPSVSGRALGPLLLLVMLLAPPVFAQGHPVLQRARGRFESLDFAAAITLARQALRDDLGRQDRILAYELLGFAYGAMDSTRQAVDAFRELIFLDPDRAPDPDRVSPRITSLYASALGQVLVVRSIRADSSTFVAGSGSAQLRFEVSRPAQVVVRAAGPGGEMVVVDSQAVAGEGLTEWRALTATGEPASPGRYRLIVEATAGRDQFAGVTTVEVRHAPVDTVAHLTALPGYAELPETEVPPRSWRPLGLATLYTGVATGAALALENTTLGSGARREIVTVSIATLLAGFVLSLKHPEPQPVPANIRYNQLLREQLARRNQEIARENAARREQVSLTIVPAGDPPR